MTFLARAAAPSFWELKQNRARKRRYLAKAPTDTRRFTTGVNYPNREDRDHENRLRSLSSWPET